MNRARLLALPAIALVVLGTLVSTFRGQSGPDPFDEQFKAPIRPVKQTPTMPPDQLPKSASKAVDLDMSDTAALMKKYVDIRASIKPIKVRRGEVAQVTLDGESQKYAYTYSAIKRTLGQSGLSAKIEYKEANSKNAEWLKPLYPIIETGTEFYRTPVDTSFILHDHFQWKQDIYIGENAPPGLHDIVVQIFMQVCTKEDAVAMTASECLTPGNYVPLVIKLDVTDEPALPAPSNLKIRLQPTTVEVERPFTDLAALLLSAFLGAILMLLTPCVFPMIPITVNYFIKQSEKEHHRPFLMASVYAGTIVLLLTVVILAAGKSIIDLANEPWFNLGLGVVLVLFALGLFGLFEVDLKKFFGTVILIAMGYGLATLAKQAIPYFARGESEFLLAVGSIAFAVPLALFLAWIVRFIETALGFEDSFVLQFLAQQESKGGILGAAFMAMTFTITSFSCTGPFLGIMLAPLAGTSFSPTHLLLAALVYAVTFAAPFFLLALFPTYLKRLPKSGGWMTTIKVTMGFLEIGAALKFLANVDLFWFPGNARLFGYDTVLCSWIALSLACSLYLFGMFHLDHDTPEKHLGVPRMIFASLFLGLALYLTPLLFNVTPTGLILESAISFLPPSTRRHGDIAWIDDDYKVAWKDAIKSKKLIFIDFTGQNCANCRANERNAFTKPNVVRELKNFVCLQLHTDSVPNPDLSAGEARKQALEQRDWQVGLKMGVTNPAYVILEPDPSGPFSDGHPSGRVVAKYKGYIGNVREFAEMLEKSQSE